MKFATAKPRHRFVLILGTPPGPRAEAAFTLVENLVVMLLLGITIATSMGALLSMSLCANRDADYIAATSVVRAKVEDIRAATYNPPNSPWLATTTYLTNSDSIALDQSGVNFKVSGTLISKIEPVSGGHLVTVTGTFLEARKTLTVTVQTVVNKYSGGQQ